MPYIVPQVRVFQEFELAAAALLQKLHAFIFGENFYLFRYSVEEEKALIGIGAYNYAAGNTAIWPNRPAGSAVDQSWTRLFFDNAWLQYFRDYVGTGHEIKVVPGYPNRITCPTLFFATYGAWPRSTEFRNRDVQVGDGVILRGECAGEPFTFYTKVAALVNDILPSVVEVPYSDSSNAPNSMVGCSMTQESGATGTVGFSCDAATYEGSEDGDTIESYFLEVIVGGDFGTAQLRVTSASGHDDPADPIIPQNAVPIAIGSRGLMATFTPGSAIPFEDGQIFRIDANENWVASTCDRDVAGVYIGTNDGTYIITVVQGGLWADGPQIFVSSTGTLDNSGPYTVVPDVWITLPMGVKIRFPSTGGQLGLSKDDRFYIDVTASAPGPIHSLDLLNSLPESARGLCYGGPGVPIDLDLSLSIIKNIEVPRVRAGVLSNWTTSATQIVIGTNILSKDSSWYDNAGTLLDLPVIKADMFVQYRSRRMTYEAVMGSVESLSLVESLLGPAVEDNPLSLGVYKAKENSGSTPVYFMATAGDTLTDFNAVLEAIYDREDVYGLVPLTHTKAILDAVLAHCVEASTPERGRWRVGWFGCKIDEVTAVLQQDQYGNILYGTITDDPDTAGTQYTRLHCAEANFVSNGVVAGQIVRANYFVNPATGIEEYEEFTVDAVLTEEDVRLYSGPDLPITVPSRFEVWKNNTHEEIAEQVIDLAGSFSNRRARVIFPDRAGNGGTQFDSMFLACSLSGLRSGAWPHQGLTNVELIGYDDMSRSTNWLGGRLLDQMAENGVWIVTQDTTGMVYSRHQLTTDMTDVNHREDSMVANFDSISYVFLQTFRNARYIGRRNITPQLLVQLETDLGGVVQQIQFESDIPGLGPQILSATILQLERHPTLVDHVIAKMRIEMPFPFNNFDLTLIAAAG